MPDTNTFTQQPAKELPDVRPPIGEYFYHDGPCASTYGGHISRPTCFACGASIGYSDGDHFFGNVQCVASGKRVNELFAPHLLYGPEPNEHGGARLIVSVCKKHAWNAQILRGLTTDGFITRERVLLARRAAISREEFRKRVGDKAWEIWNRNVQDRRHRNWLDAWGLCLRKLGRIPSFSERGAQAERLHEERKEQQALDDWFAAEKEIGDIFTIV